MEVWLEPSLDGVILHYFLHAEPAGAAACQLAKMNLAKLNHRRRVAGKKMSFEVKTTLEAARPVRNASARLIPGQTQRRQVDFHSIECDAIRGTSTWRTRRRKRSTSMRILRR